jgi:hypothetical protein
MTGGQQLPHRFFQQCALSACDMNFFHDISMQGTNVVIFEGTRNFKLFQARQNVSKTNP